MKTLRNSPLLCVLSVVISLAGTGCKAIKPESMVAKSFTLESKHPGTLSVTVAHNSPDKRWGEGQWTSQIKSATFAQSLTGALQKSGVFSSVLDADQGDYVLQVSCVDSKEPAMGLNMKVILETKWILTKRSTSEDVFRENISTTYVATLGRAFAGAKRLRLANEGAGRENIKEGIRRLSAIKL